MQVSHSIGSVASKLPLDRTQLLVEIGVTKTFHGE